LRSRILARLEFLGNNQKPSLPEFDYPKLYKGA
jgi:hypothetical protein